MRKFVLFGFCLVLFFFVDSANAADQTTVLTDVSEKFSEAAATWQTTIMRYADRLFWGLVVINMVFTFGFQFIKGQISDMRSFFASFMEFTLLLGFFYWLLQKGPGFAKTIIDSMIQVGTEAGGTGEVGALVDTAIDIFMNLIGTLSMGSPLYSLLTIIIAVILLLTLIMIAANVTVEYCAAWILLYAGAFFLGFGSTRWTSDMAIKYFQAVLGTSVRLMSMFLMIGVASSIINKYAANLSREYYQLAVLLTVVLIFFSLMNKVPPMIAGLVAGQSGGGAGSLGFGSLMSAGSMAVGGAMLGYAGARGAISGAASGGSKLSSLIKNASSAAPSSGAGGAGSALSGLASAGGSSGGGGGGDSGSNMFSGGGSFASPVDSGGGGSSGSKSGSGMSGSSGDSGTESGASTAGGSSSSQSGSSAGSDTGGSASASGANAGTSGSSGGGDAETSGSSNGGGGAGTSGQSQTGSGDSAKKETAKDAATAHQEKRSEVSDKASDTSKGGDKKEGGGKSNADRAKEALKIMGQAAKDLGAELQK